MVKIVSHAVAKVNLMLRIYKKLSNGYHCMQSIFAFLPDIYDILHFYVDIPFSEVSGNIENVPAENNSIKIAANILKKYFNFQVPHVEIEKQIPSEAGLGGGSSDAACFINSVFDLWKFPLKEKYKYINLFEPLGADARVFLFKYFFNENLLYLDGSGIDGIIQSLEIPELKDCYLVIISNGSKLSTKTVFQNFHYKTLLKINAENINFQQILNFENSLQTVAIQLDKSLSKTLSDLKATDPLVYGVSGSGSSCFGLFSSKPKAALAKEVLSKKYHFTKISSTF